MNLHYEAAEEGAEVRRAMRLIVDEAALLDERDYVSWDALWADGDTRYVVPIDRDADSFDDRLNFINDDSDLRRLRVGRMSGGYAHAGNSTGPTLRSVSRFRLLEANAGVVRISTAQVIISYRRGEQEIWASDVTYVIEVTGETAKLRQKVVRLVDSESAIPTCGFLP